MRSSLPVSRACLVIYKSAKKWYEMRMCISWLCSFNIRKEVGLDFGSPHNISGWCVTMPGKLIIPWKWWHIKQKNKKTRKNTRQIFPEQKTKKSFALHHLCPVHKVLTEIWNPLISAQIVNSFGQGKCYVTFDCQSRNLKVYASRNHVSTSPCMLRIEILITFNILVCGHFIRIHSCLSICFSRTYTNNYKH